MHLRSVVFILLSFLLLPLAPLVAAPAKLAAASPPNVTIDKTVHPASVAAGETAKYVITLSNSGTTATNRLCVVSPLLHAVAAIDGASHAVTEVIAGQEGGALSGVYAVALDGARGWLCVIDDEGLLAANELSGEVEEVLPAQALAHRLGLVVDPTSNH